MDVYWATPLRGEKTHSATSRIAARASGHFGRANSIRTRAVFGRVMVDAVAAKRGYGHRAGRRD